jgi:hypothetical protein
MKDCRQQPAVGINRRSPATPPYLRDEGISRTEGHVIDRGYFERLSVARHSYARVTSMTTEKINKSNRDDAFGVTRRFRHMPAPFHCSIFKTGPPLADDDKALRLSGSQQHHNPSDVDPGPKGCRSFTQQIIFLNF